MFLCGIQAKMVYFCAINILYFIMKVGLLVAGPKIASKIKASHDMDYKVIVNSASLISKLVVFDPLDADEFRDFDYSASDWKLIFDEYESLSSIDLLPSILVRAIIRIGTNTTFNIHELAQAIDKKHRQLPSDVARNFLKDIWRLSCYSANIYHREIVIILSKYNPEFSYKSDKPVVTDAIEYCLEETAKSSNRYSPQGTPPFEFKDIFSKIFLMDSIIGKLQKHPHTDNKLINLILWKRGFVPTFDWATLISFFHCFMPTEQLNIVRKIAYGIKTNELQVTITDLILLVESSPEIKTIHEKVFVSKANKYLKILIHSLDSYSRTGKFLTQGKIFDILTDLKDTRSKVSLSNTVRMAQTALMERTEPMGQMHLLLVWIFSRVYIIGLSRPTTIPLGCSARMVINYG